MPFAIFQRAFPVFVIVVVLGEAAILTAGRIPWRQSLACSLVANISSYIVGFLIVGMSRGGAWLPGGPETFRLQSHLWFGFTIAFVPSVVIDDTYLSMGESKQMNIERVTNEDTLKG